MINGMRQYSEIKNLLEKHQMHLSNIQYQKFMKELASILGI